MSIDVNVQNDLVIVTESSEDIVVNVSNAAGPQGPAGQGVPVGGSTGQVLKKLSGTNYDTYWALDGGGGVPYSGATGDVDLGEFEMKAGQVEFDQTPTGTAGVGVMRWNDSDGTVDLGLKGGNVTLQVGQEQILRVVNKTGADLLESQYRAVRIRLAAEGGSQGQRLAVVLAQGNNDANSTDTIGIVTETISNNQEGFICTSGIVRGINTTGSLQGETWADGDIIYLSPTIAGAITKVKPTAPSHSVILGYVIYAHNVNGKIFVKCDNGYELTELHDVYAPSPSNNESIFWNSTNLRYENKTVAGALGFTPISGSGATGQVAYWNGSGTQAGSNNLFWDATNNRLGIGTTTPSDKLHVAGTAKFTDNVSIIKATNPYLLIDNTGTGGKSFTLVSASDGTFQFQNTGVSIPLTIAYTGESTFSNSVTANQLIINNVNTPAAKFYRNVDVGTFGEAGQGIEFGAKSGSTYVSSAAIYGGLEASGTSGNLSFRTLNSGTLTERARFTAAGRFLLGTTSEGTDLLLVNGTAKISDTLLIQKNIDSGTALLNVNNTSGGASAVAGLQLTSNQISGALFSTSSAFTGIGSLTSNMFGLYSDSFKGVHIFVNSVTGYFAVHTGAGDLSEKMRITPAGRLLLGTTTESTYLLDVNGTARVSGQITAPSLISSSHLILGENGVARYTINGNEIFRNSGSGWLIAQFLGGSGIGTYGLYVTTNLTRLGAASNLILSVHGVNQNVSIDTPGSSPSTDASSLLQVNSTTRGFLPPRMTTTEKNAIASPAVGLMVYCTDATEGLYEYTSAGWVNLNGIVTNRQTASYTLALTDVNDLVEMNVATANNLTVPLNSSIAFPVGTKIDIAQYGAGQTTVVATGGVTIRSAGGALKLAAQYSGGSLVKIGTDEWYLFGNITT